jgi:tape measure domain-containing protein
MSLATTVRSLAAAYLGVRTITQSIRLAVEVEQAQASFEVLTGSAQTAAAVLQNVRAFSETSPISFSGATEAAKMMMAFNIPVQQVSENIKMLGDISMGNQQRFDSLTLAFSQMSSAGRLMGQDLLQMVNAGFNPLQEISEQTGESMVELKARMEDGAISAEEVRNAFLAATGDGGRFDGMAEKLAGTMGGKMQIAMSNLEKSGARLGEAIGPLVISLTDGFNEGQSALDFLILGVEKLADGLGFIGAIAKDVFSNIASGFTKNDPFEAVNKHLDQIQARERERASRAQAAAVEIPPMDAPDAPPPDTSAADEALQKQEEIDDAFKKQLENLYLQTLEMQGHKDLAQQIRLEAEGYNKTQIEAIQKQQQFIEDAKQKAQAEKEFALEVQQAAQAANQYFERERQRDVETRNRVSEGPGAGIEAGSGEAAKFMADQVNRSIGAAAVPERPTPGEKEIVDKTRELIEAQRAANAEQVRQSNIMQQQLVELRDNKFKRLG